MSADFLVLYGDIGLFTDRSVLVLSWMTLACIPKETWQPREEAAEINSLASIYASAESSEVDPEVELPTEPKIHH